MALTEITTVDDSPPGADDDIELFGVPPEPTRRRRRTTSTGDGGGGGGGGHLPYFPALDGVRGLAVISVLFFHAGFSWAVGGYLGVSTFFTLSGFLITSLILAERAATGTIGLKGFWTRRFRRLLPAALAAIALGVVVALVIDPVQRRNIGGDVVASLGYVANWRFVFSGQSYAELFTSPSPLQHFWSLAIEEQFYLIYPLFAFCLLRVAHGSRRVFTIALAAITAASVALPFIFSYSHDRIYYGTDARAAELLMGAMLATALYYRPITDRLAGSRRVQVVAATLGAAALVACIVMWSRIEQQNDLLYAGGFFVYSILSVLVILAALLPLGPVASVLAIRPLRFMGKISYGVYLYHWPIFMALSEPRVHLSGVSLFAVQVALTVGVACASYRFLEMPIRRGQPLFRGTRRAVRPVRLAPFVVCLLAVAAIVVGLTSPPPLIDFEQAQQELQFTDAPPPVFDPTSVTPPRPRIATFGDSTALQTSFGLGPFLRDTDRGDLVQGVTPLGCSFIRGGSRADIRGEGFNAPECDNWPTTFKDAIAKSQPNIALVQEGPWEVEDHRLPEETNRTLRHLGDPIFDKHLAAEMTGVIDTLSAGGAEVLWMTLPPMSAPAGQDPLKLRGQGADPARQQKYNDIVRALPFLRPGKVHVIDLAGWLASTGEDARLRPDGVHFSTQPNGGTAYEISKRWLADAIINAFDTDWTNQKKAEFDLQHATATTAPPAPAPGATGTAAAPTATPADFTAQLGGLAPPRVEVIGDSAALGLALGMDVWSKADGKGVWTIASKAIIGCGIGRGGNRKNHDKAEPVPKECQNWATDYPKVLAKDRPDMIVVMDGLWDATDRQLNGDPTWRAPGDLVYDTYLTAEFSQAADVLHGRGAPVSWLTFPPIDLGRGEPNHAEHPYPVSDPARMQRINDIVRTVAATRPWMHVIDLADYANHFPQGPLDPDMRIDGVHFSAEAADRITNDFLATQLLQIYHDANTKPADSLPLAQSVSA
jgi:peptidoglycan/LPS O-acetylase OafA/YrhL